MVAWFALQVDPIFHGKGKDVIVTVTYRRVFVGRRHADARQRCHRLHPRLRHRHDHLRFVSGRSGLVPDRAGLFLLTRPSIFSGPPNVVTVDVLAGQTLHEVAVNVVADGESAGFGDTSSTLRNRRTRSTPVSHYRLARRHDRYRSIHRHAGRVAVVTRHGDGGSIRQTGRVGWLDAVDAPTKDSTPISWSSPPPSWRRRAITL